VVASRVGPGGPVAGGRRVAVAEQAALARAAVRSDDGTVAAAPLVHDGRLLGVVEVVRAAFDPFDDDDLAVLDAIAQPAARAIGHARAYRALRKRAESGD
jgi:GAF domain-containing protein